MTHPTSDELRALSLGRLDESDLDRVSAHLAACADCCQRIDRLQAPDPLLDRLRETVAVGEEALVGPSQRRSAVRALRQRRSSAGSRWDDAPRPPLDLPVPRLVGEYDIVAEVGRGGMGVVYKAIHRGLHRTSALKMVLAGEFASRSQELRFRLEAELASRVQHPNIVQVYEIGVEQGRLFLAMEWVEGGSLADRIDGRPWRTDTAARLVETLARAIHVAHGKGVIHRDLKPANVLLQRAESDPAPDEALTLSDGTNPTPLRLIPKIADFGLARSTDGGISLTRSGTLVGTPGYMSPEQVGGGRREAPVGPATDIYALGVILYQLLTGRLPFPGENTLDVLRAVANDEPPRPRRLRPRLPRDLEAIVLHCLRKEPHRRYHSALALADDLRRYLDGGQVVARPVSQAARFARAVRRRPVVASLAVLLATSLVGGLAGVTWKWLEADEQRSLASASARRADGERRAALAEAYRARLSAASASLAAHDVAAAARQLDAAPAALRGWEWRHLHSRLDDSAAVLPLPEGGGGLLAPGPDRLRIGLVDRDGFRLVEADAAELASKSHATGKARAVSAGSTSQGLRVLAYYSGGFELFDPSGAPAGRIVVPGGAQPRVALSPDGTRVAWPKNVPGWSRLRLGDPRTGRPTLDIEGHAENIWSFAFSPEGRRIATGGEDRIAKLWDPASGSLLATFRGHSSKVLGVSFSPDGRRLLTASADGTVRQWDAASGLEIEPPYDRHSGNVTAASYSPDGLRVASTGSDRTVRVWLAKGRQDIAVLHGHTGNVTDIAFAPDGHRLATISTDSMLSIAGDATIRTWDADPRATLPVLRGHSAEIYPVAYSPDGLWLASGGWDSTARLWDATTGELCATLPHPGVVHDLAYAPDGTWLATASLADNRIRMWDAATGRLLKAIDVPGGGLRSISIDPGGRRIAALAESSPGSPNCSFLCEVDSGKVVYSSERPILGFSPDGLWIVTRDPDEKGITLLDARSHSAVKRFQGHEARVASIAFSPDGARMASCGRDRTVRVWRIDDGSCRVLRGHTDEVFDVAFHPDGTRLASAGRDRSVWLWDLARNEEVVQLQGHTGYVWSLAFSPDGKTLASGSGDFTVRLWDTEPLRSRLDARRQADALRPEVEAYLASSSAAGKDALQVAAAIRSDTSLSVTMRQAVLRAVLRSSPGQGRSPGM